MTAIADVVPAGKLNNVLKAELKGLMKSFGWEFHTHTNGRHYAKDNLGRDRIVNADRAELERSALAFLREQSRAKVAGTIKKGEETMITSETTTDETRPASLAEQAAELDEMAGESAGGKLADLITFAFRGHEPSEYPALKAAAKADPGFGTGRDSSEFTADEKLARAAFLVCYGWEKEARKRARASGTYTPAARATSTSATIASKPARIPAKAGAALRDLLLALADWDGGMRVADLRATLADGYAAAITIPAYSAEEIRARNLAKGLKDRAGAESGPKVATMDEARELAADLERETFVIRIGARYEVCGLKRAKMEAKYAAATNAAITATVQPDGTVIRHTPPLALSTATIAPALVASLTPAVDPASVANVVNPQDVAAD